VIGSVIALAYLRDVTVPPDSPHLSQPMLRTSARVALVASGRVLLFSGADPAAPGDSFWFTVGGGVEPGETLRSAATRELREETGHAIADNALVGPVWRRHAHFRLDGRRYESDEWFFVAHWHERPEPAIDTAGFTSLEVATIHTHHWWSEHELRTTDATVYPLQLAELLPEVLAADWDGQCRSIE